MIAFYSKIDNIDSLYTFDPYSINLDVWKWINLQCFIKRWIFINDENFEVHKNCEYCLRETIRTRWYMYVGWFFLAGVDAFFFDSMNSMRCQPINMFCHLSCANGFEKDGSGCDICHCKGVGEIENAQEKYIRMTFRY